MGVYPVANSGEDEEDDDQPDYFLRAHANFLLARSARLFRGGGIGCGLSQRRLLFHYAGVGQQVPETGWKFRNRAGRRGPAGIPAESSGCLLTIVQPSCPKRDDSRIRVWLAVSDAGQFGIGLPLVTARVRHYNRECAMALQCVLV
jgi:hypothetical protein